MATLTTARECAARWGISEAMARRTLAPLHPVDRDPITGAMRYNLTEAESARASQPGRGQRADLTTPAITPAELQRLTTDESIPATHRALWALMQSGMRVGDALSLDVSDVNLDGKEAVVEVPVKDTEPQTFPLSEQAAKLARQIAAGRSEGPLLADEKGRPVTRYSASKMARAMAGTSIHTFKPRPHTPQPATVVIQMKDLQVEDILHLDGREITVRTVKSVKAPTGGHDIQINLGSDFPIFGDAREKVTITARSYGA